MTSAYRLRILNRCQVLPGALWREVPGALQPELPCRVFSPGQDPHHRNPQHQAGPGQAQSSPGCQHGHRRLDPEAETGGLMLEIYYMACHSYCVHFNVRLDSEMTFEYTTPHPPSINQKQQIFRDTFFFTPKSSEIITLVYYLNSVIPCRWNISATIQQYPNRNIIAYKTEVR